MKTKQIGLAAAIVGFVLIGVIGFAADGDLIVNGNVGIGTTNPAARLDINGTNHILKISTENVIAADTNYIRGMSTHLVINANGDLYLNYPEGNAASTRIGEALFVQRLGAVGIGTTSPAGRLDVSDVFYTGIGTLVVRPQVVGGLEGGEIDLLAPGGTYTQNWSIDNFMNRLRFFIPTLEIMTMTNAGNIGVRTIPNNILSVLQASPTDPIADSWTTYACDRTTKDIIRVLPNQSGALDQLLGVELYEWRRKPLVSDDEIKGLSEKVIDVDELERKRQDLSAEKSKLPKFQAKRLGVMLDDPNIPEEIISVDGAGKKGIDFIGYIGWLHATIKELALRVQELEKR